MKGRSCARRLRAVRFGAWLVPPWCFAMRGSSCVCVVLCACGLWKSTLSFAAGPYTNCPSSPAAATWLEKTMFRAPASSHNKPHATVMQPLQCVLQYQVATRMYMAKPLPEVITSLSHHSCKSVTTSQSHHFRKSSSLPKITTSVRHHIPKSPLPKVITSPSHHFSQSPLP